MLSVRSVRREKALPSERAKPINRVAAAWGSPGAATSATNAEAATASMRVSGKGGALSHAAAVSGSGLQRAGGLRTAVTA